MAATATPKKGRPTPKAPQNRPKPKVQDEAQRRGRVHEYVRSRLRQQASPRAPELTAEDRERIAARLRYRAFRRRTRPMRRAFGARAADARRAGACSHRAMVRDAHVVWALVNDEGLIDLATIASRAGMKQRYVERLIATFGQPGAES